MENPVKIFGVEITHPEKVIYPEFGITKFQMVQYYNHISDQILPHLKDRPLTLQRFPDGVSHPGFYQKKADDYFPSFVQRVEIETEDGSNLQVVCNNKKTLIYLANQGVLSFHTWLSKRDQLRKPDKIVFDLDPSRNEFDKLKDAARIIREYLKEEDRDPEIMTTGQNGFHIWYTVRRTKTFDEWREEIKSMAQELEKRYPKLLTTAVRKNKRDGKIFIDYLRNSYAQTSICPYSLRPNKTGGIAMPISWDQLSMLTSADEFNLKDKLQEKNRK